jgi:glycosyltransferase involved in cell wall biosynthesis
MDPVMGGGTAERTFQLAKYFSGRGSTVTILTTDSGLSEDRRKTLGGINVIGLRCLFRRFFVVEPRFTLIASLVRRSTIIHLMGHWNILNVIVVFFAWRHRIPYVICPAGELRLFGRSLLLKRIFNILVGNRIVRYASGCIAVTESEFPEFESYGIKASSIQVLPNGIVPDALISHPQTDILSRIGCNKKNYILFMGRLNLIKGPDLLLRAFSKVANANPQLHLVFAGPDGGLLNKLSEETRIMGLQSRVHFAGYVTDGDKATLYKEALFLAIPSRHEAMSIVVLEAGSVSVPVLLTKRCGFNRVADVSGGELVEVSVNDISKGIDCLLRNRDSLEEMGKNLKKLVLDHYSWDYIGLCHENYFQSIANPKYA